jgi:lysosomal Pro-X carboxypeptidase
MVAPLLLLITAAVQAAPRWHHDGVLRRLGDNRTQLPGTANCTEYFFRQELDHFDFQNNVTFLQRYFVHDGYWKPGGPIFFYAGNEADVTLYVNHTGLMWESAEQFGALLLFAEHRYWGQSCPFSLGATCGDDMKPENPNAQQKQFLTYEQVLLDFVRLLAAFQRERVMNAPVIAFGGSCESFFHTRQPHTLSRIPHERAWDRPFLT